MAIYSQAILGSPIGANAIDGSTMGLSGAGTLIAITQNVGLLVPGGTGSLVTITQSVVITGSGTLVSFDQFIDTVQNNLTKFGWDARLYIAGVRVDADQIHGSINITRTENNAALLDVTLLPDAGAQDVDSWHGKSIALDAVTASGTTRIYTGVIDIPEFNILDGKITLRCTDKRDELINAQMSAVLPSIGYWSDAIFDEPDDTADELRQRLLTVPKVVDFDASGQYHITNLLPKSTADFTLTDSDVYRREPRLSIASRARLVNKVNVDFEFRYVRLRHRERDFTLQGYTFCEIMTQQGTFLNLNNVVSALESFAWPVDMNSVTAEALPLAGWYNCVGMSQFWWSGGIEYHGYFEQQLDANKQPMYEVVTDIDGNVKLDAEGNPVLGDPIGQSYITGYTDYRSIHTSSVDFTAAYHFAQDVSEKISLTITAPQSIAQYGEIEQWMNHGYEVEYDPAVFEQNTEYTSPGSLTDSGGDYYVDKVDDLAKYYSALNAAASIAQTRIISSHRDNTVTVEVPFWPEVDLRHTVALDTTPLEAIGKVSQLTHRINISTREAYSTVTLAFSRSTGSQAATTLTLPLPSAPVVGGYDTDTLIIDAKEGVFASPEIDDESRNRQEHTVSLTHEIPITNNPLTVTFT